MTGGKTYYLYLLYKKLKQEVFSRIMRKESCLKCFVFLLILSSCASPGALQNSLSNYKCVLDYEFDSKIDTSKKNKKIFLKISDKLSLEDSTKVKLDGFFILPLLIAGGNKYDFTITLGKRNIKPSINEFFYNAYQLESIRSGNFELADKESGLALEIDLVDCRISTKYHKDIVYAGQSSKKNWILKPITGFFKIEVRLLEKGNILFKKIYISNKSAHLETVRYNSESEIKKILMEKFAKTVSMEIKELIETSIIDINKQIN